MTLLINDSSDELTFGGVRYAKDAATSTFEVPEAVAAIILQHPGGFARAPDVAPAEPEAVARTVDFLAPAPFARYNIGARGFGSYEASSDAIVYSVAPEHCAAMLSNGCVPLPPAGWTDPRPA